MAGGKQVTKPGPIPGGPRGGAAAKSASA